MNAIQPKPENKIKFQHNILNNQNNTLPSQPNLDQTNKILMNNAQFNNIKNQRNNQIFSEKNLASNQNSQQSVNPKDPAKYRQDTIKYDEQTSLTQNNAGALSQAPVFSKILKFMKTNL
jgi:hypothetical protein